MRRPRHRRSWLSYREDKLLGRPLAKEEVRYVQEMAAPNTRVPSVERKPRVWDTGLLQHINRNPAAFAE